MKVSKKHKSIISILLAITLIITLLPQGTLVQAADAGMDINIHFYDADQAYEGKVYLQYWQEGTATVSVEGVKMKPTGWGGEETLYLLNDEKETEGDDWYGLNVKGSMEGMQFVNTATGKCEGSYNAAMKNYSGDLYFYKGEFYTENPVKNTDAKKFELAKPKNVFYLVGDIVSPAWDSTNLNYPLKEQKDGTYSIELKDIPAGAYGFKVLQDPEAFAWNYAWGGSGAGGNYELTLKKKSNVTISMDPADEKYQLKVTTEETGGVEIQSPVYNEDGTVTFQYVSTATNASIGVRGNVKTPRKKSLIRAEFAGDLGKGQYLYVATSAAIKDAGLYKYSFYEINEDGTLGKELGEPNSTTKYASAGAFVRNPVMSASGLVTIYYPYDGEGAQVYYRNANSKKTALKVGDKAGAAVAKEYGYTVVDMKTDSDFTGGGMYSAKFFDEDGTYTYVLVKDGVVVEDKLNFGENTFTEKDVDTIALSVDSPVIQDDGTVKFMYYAAGSSAELSSMCVAGEFNDWTIGKTPMTMDADGKGIWSVTMDLTPGVYQYKFVQNGGNWMADPLAKVQGSSDGNSAVVVPGLAPSTAVSVAKGGQVTLPATANKYTQNVKTPETVDVTYKMDKVAGASLDGNVLKVDESFEGSSVDLTISDGETEDTCSVEVVSKTYQYTIHYYAEDTTSYDNRDLWIWEQSGKAYNVGYEFTGTTTDSKGRIWATAVYNLPSNAISVIVRSKGGWSYQEKQRDITLDVDAEGGEFWITQNGSEVLTKCPEDIDAGVKRYVIVQYERPQKDYEGWNLYTWTSLAQYKEIANYFTNVNGVYQTMFMIDEDTSSVGFNIRRSAGENDMWAEKDQGDHYMDTPLDQNIIIAKFTQGSSEPTYLPYNTGYELNAKDHEINFYYRDDALLLDGTLGSLKSVQVTINNQVYDMTYDAENARYEYTLKNPANGEYEYNYTITSASGEAVTVKDAFNSRTSADGTKSVVSYKEMSAKVTMTCTNSAISYDDNTVIGVSVDNKDVEVVDAWVDLTSLGGKAKTAIDPKLMALTIGVTNGTSVGTKTLPITVVDQYGMEYTGSGKITVKQRVQESANDFDWDEAVIYFMLTDRFKDGNAANNGGKEYDKSNVNAYHGGDFAGVTQKLDYLQDLGINTIWITPVVDNVAEGVMTNEGTMAYGYHGYWATNFTQLDEHLGTEEEFRTLISEAHNRGIRIMVDIVINHSGYNTKENANFAGMYRDVDVDSDAELSSQDGLPDFATERQEVRSQLIDWQKSWVEKYDIDYFRVDTVKHVDSTTWDALKNALTEYSSKFKMIGEYYGASYTDDADHLNSGNMDSLLDFDFKTLAKDFVTGNLSSVEEKMEDRNGALTNVGTFGSFLSSHDENGFKFTIANLKGSDNKKLYTESQADALAKVAASLSLTAKGQPVIYYGEEIGLTGEYNYPNETNRYDMQFDNLDASQEAMLTHYKKMLSIRKLYSKVFAKGDRVKVAGSDKEQYMAFERSYKGQNVVVALNIGETARKATLKINDFAGMEVKDVYGGTTYRVKADGTVTITIPGAAAGGTAVLVAESEIPVSKITVAQFTNAIADKTALKANVKDLTTGENIANWKFMASDLKKSKVSAKDVSLSCTVTDASENTTVDSILDADSKNSKGAVVTFAHSGTFPASAQVKVYLGNQNSISYGSKVYVYRLSGTKLQETAVSTAKVDKNGFVTLYLMQGGTYVLLPKKASSSVTKKLVDTVSVSLSSSAMKKGSTRKVSVTVPASNMIKVSAFNEDNMSKLQSAQTAVKITYKSSNKKVATISSAGKISAKKKGKTTITITVRLSNGQKKTIQKKISVK